jgi:type IV pilus assembly protein PilC
MPIYSYVAKDVQGKQVKGEIPSDSKQNALAAIKFLKLFPIKITEKADGREEKKSDKSIFKPKVKKKDIAIFTRQFASMLRSGLPLTVILDVMIKQERNSTFREVLEEIIGDIMKGYTLSASMTKFKVFPPLLLSMVEVGEANGRLDASLERIAVNMEKEIKMVSKVKSAMIYPAVLLTVTILASLLLTFMVLPVFTNMFKQAGAKLPPLTSALVGYGNFMRSYWYIPIGSIILIIIIFIRVKNEPSVKMQIDKMMLRLPLIGRLQNIIIMARFCRIFSSLVDAGIGVIEALHIVKNVIKNAYVKSSFDQIIEDVQSGSFLSVAVSKYKMFTPLVVSTIKIGEEAGNLGEALGRTAELYEEESEVQLQRASALAEPAVTVIMAVGVGLLVISIVQPMFGMYNLVGK